MSPPCPGCGAPLTGTSPCPSCGLPLVGPDAARLWQVDQELAALAGRQDALGAERERLLAALRTGTTITSPTAVAGFPSPPMPARQEANPAQVQNTLLALGALLLAVAGIVFAAVTYRYLGPTGRALILLVLTGAAALAPMVLAKRGLSASAEALAAVALVLGILDAWVLRRAGLADGTDSRSYSAVASALLATAAAGYATVVPLRVVRVSAVVLAQLPCAFVLARTDPPRPVSAAVLAALAAADLLLASARRLPGDVRAAATACSATALLASLALSSEAARQHDDAAGLGLVAAALVLVAASSLMTDAVLRGVLSGLAVPLLGAAARVSARPTLTHDQRPLVLAAVALLTLTAAGLLPERHRPGPAYGGLAVIVAAVLSQAEPILVALGGPFTWLGQAWTLTTTDARAAVSVDDRWSGTVITLIVVAVAAVCAAMMGLLLDRVAALELPTGALLALAAALLPLGLATSYQVALAVLIACTAAAAVGAWLTEGAHRNAALVAGGALALRAAVWASADRDATLVVLPVLALLTAALALRVPVATAASALLAAAALGAVGADSGMDEPQVALLLLAAPAACVALSFVLRLTRRVALEGAAVVVAGASVVLAEGDLTALSISLGASGLLALAVTIRPDRHEVGLLGGLLLSASSWVRLADAHVHAPEPYAAPLAVTALVFGHLRRRNGPASSFQAYGPGLAVALVPSLLKSLDDDTPTRGLGLLVVCVLVLLAGGYWRLRAPLVIGGVVLVLDALHLLRPVAAALPRWSLLALAGGVLLGVGLTYEARRRDLARLKTRYEGLT